MSIFNYSYYRAVPHPVWPAQPSTWCSKYSPASYAYTQNMSTAYLQYSISRNGGNSTRVKGVLQLTENNYSMSMFSDKQVYYRKHYCTAPYGYRQENNIRASGDLAPLVPTITGPTDDFFLNKLLEKYKDSEFNLGVAAGEGRETLSAIYNAARSLTKAAINIKKGNLPNAIRQLSGGISSKDKKAARRALELGDLGSTWMALRYGWIPLLGDIHGLQALQVLYSYKKKLTASYYDVKAIPPRNSFQTVHQGAVMKAWKWTAFLQPGAEPSWADRLGLTDPVSVAWELVPFSFVVDWFAPIGRLTSAIAATRIIPVTSITKTTFQRSTYIAVPSAAMNCFDPSGIPMTKRVDLSRTVNHPMPSAASLLAIPSKTKVQFDTELKRALDASIMAGFRIKNLVDSRSRVPFRK